MTAFAPTATLSASAGTTVSAPMADLFSRVSALIATVRTAQDLVRTPRHVLAEQGLAPADIWTAAEAS